MPKVTTEVRVVRGGSMSDDDLLRRMAVVKEHPVYEGVMEIVDRLEEAVDDAFCDARASRDARADAGIQKATIRELRKQIAGWRASGEAFLKEKRS